MSLIGLLAVMISQSQVLSLLALSGDRHKMAPRGVQIESGNIASDPVQVQKTNEYDECRKIRQEPDPANEEVGYNAHLKRLYFTMQ
jgi:hypothetical protein